ncbi:MAG: hypothetical protein LBJ21_02775 [Acidobacteriota bacterium]|jgi:hypothetical protein|nr:hypothetical protein [Acidobacteriota bacterium]
MTYDNNNGGAYGKYFIQELQEPESLKTPEFREMYRSFANRILWIDGNVVPGAFQMNTAWYIAAPESGPFLMEHAHDHDELIGFYGSNPDDPYDLGGVIELSINGEAHRLTRSTMVFVPGGTKHNPLRILEVRRPIFHFSVVTNPEYDGGAYKSGNRV